MSKEILRMGGGRIINISRINKLVQKAATERMSEYDSGAIQDALSSMCEDQRLSDDPLTALAAVMRHHNLEFATVDGITIAYSDAGIVLDIEKSDPITADDIKPE